MTHTKKAIFVVPCRFLIAISFGFLVTQSQAQSLGDITPEQMAQFQALSPALQEQLAGQLGVDLSVLQGLTGQSVGESSVGQVGAQLEQVQQIENPFTFDLFEDFTEEEDQELERYGLALFDQEVSTFAPVDDAPLPSDYVMGPGDSFNVLLFGTDNQNLVLSVDREGGINFPRLGAISVAGLTFSEAKQLIETRVSEQLIGVSAVISAGRLRAINVFMAGEVKTPGAYSVSGLTTVTQALFVAGGVSDIGSLRDVRVLRANQLIASFDAYGLLMRGDASQDIRLQSGDVLFVPPVAAVASIDGAVRRPAIYELVPGEGIEDLVDMAGRYEPKAFIKMVTLERFDRNQPLPELFNLDLTNETDISFELMDGDYLNVPLAGETFSNGIEIKGAVLRPGIYAYQEGLRLSDLLPSIDSHLNVEADLSYALIVSIKNERLDIEVTSFDLLLAITNPGTQNDPLLSSRDQILVFDLPEPVEDTDIDIDLLLEQYSDFVLEDTPNDALTASLAPSDVSRDTQNFASNAMSASDPNSPFFNFTDNSSSESEDDDPDFSRKELLTPIIAKLRLQSRENEPVQIVSVSGAVKAAGEYPLKEGDRLSILLSAAGGLTDDAFLNEAELQRVFVDESGFADTVTTNVDLTQRFNNPLHDPILNSRDHVFVRSIPDWVPDHNITISGEVRFPGEYPIGPRETIGDAILRAGGLTNIGFAEGAVFTRESAREQQRAQLQEYVDDIRKSVAVKSLTQEVQSLDILAVENVIDLLTKQEPLGRLVINLPSILAGNFGADIILQEGDAITIPPQTDTVAVIGEVRRTGVYRHQDALVLEDYIEISAGVTARADEDAIYVVKADGTVATVRNELFQFSGSDNALSPGDTIVVPVNAEYRDTITYWSTITSIIYQTGIAVAAVVTIL